MHKIQEENLNSLIHFICAALCALAPFFFYGKNVILGDWLIIFFFFMVSSYALMTSFVYHGSKEKEKREANRVLDKSGIYFMIMSAGVTFTYFNKNMGYKILLTASIVLLTSFLVFRFCTEKENQKFTLGSYILLGIFCSFAPFLVGENRLDQNLDLVAAGCVSYLVGVLFYLKDHRKWMHFLWHISVVIGFWLQAGALIALI